MERRLNIEHIFVHGIFQLIAGIVYGFGIFVLMARGYNAAEAGLCMSIASGMNLVGQPIISDYLDKSKKITAFDGVVYLSFITGGLFLINALLPNKSLILSIVYILCTFIYALMEPLINSFSSSFINKGLKVEFSSARAVGSLSYGAACLIFGFISEVQPYTIIILCGTAFCVALGITAFLIGRDFNAAKSNVEVSKTEDNETIPFKEFIKHNKKFVLMCVAFTGIFLGYTCIDNFMLLVMENVGGTSSDMGGNLAFKAFIEGIAIFLFPFLVKKFDLNALLNGAAVAFIMKSLTVYLASSVAGVYFAQSFQILSFGILFPGMIEYINRYMNKKEAIRANALFTMTICGGSMLSSVIAGSIANTYGTSAMELMALIITTVSVIFFCAVMFMKK